MTPAGAVPIGDDEITALLSSLSARERPGEACGFGLAVSGGADSMALLHIAARWRVLHPEHETRLVVLTVDHRLRAEAVREIDAVASAAKAAGLEHRVLVWREPRSESGVQAAARIARYLLFAEAMRAEGLRAVLTAHTLEDQAETLLMRLARGSGVAGLSAMQAESEIEGARILRPLLGISRSRLEATLRAAGILWCDDPSNVDPRHERVRLRAIRPHLAAVGLDPAPIARSAARLAMARAALEQEAARVLRDDAVVRPDPLGFVEVAWRGLSAAPRQVRLMVLERVLARVGGQDGAPTLEQLERLFDGSQMPPAQTVAGCRIEPMPAGLLQVTRELGRIPPAPAVVAPGERILWDGRFEVGLNDRAKGPLHVGCLGDRDLDDLKRDGSLDWLGPARRLPRAVLLTVPVFRFGSELVAAPTLGIARPGGTGASAAWRGLQA